MFDIETYVFERICFKNKKLTPVWKTTFNIYCNIAQQEVINPFLAVKFTVLLLFRNNNDTYDHLVRHRKISIWADASRILLFVGRT